MINLQNLKVTVQNADIAPMVLSLTMFETIKGNIRGSMTVLDNMNFMDTFIATSHAPIEIHWQYESYQFTYNFYGDGISDMQINKLGKQYTIHFLAYTTMNAQVKRINNAFSGRSDQIIYDIFTEINDNRELGRLMIDTRSITKGKYIVPNIKCQEALNNVVNSSWDNNKSPLLLYQRLADEGDTRLTSLSDMNDTEFGLYEQNGTIVYKNTFTLKATVAGADEESDGLEARTQIGTVSKFVMDEFNTNFTHKIASGYYGQKVQNISLDETSSNDFPPAELTNIPATYYKLQNNLFDGDTKSVFSTLCEPDSYLAYNQKRRVFNHRMTAMDTVAVPGLSVGYSIETDSGGSNMSNSKTDTKYIIASIQHRFTMQDGEFQYAQDIGLIRDGTE